MPFACHTHALDSVRCVLVVEGDVDVATAPLLRHQLTTAITHGHDRVLVDLAAVGHIDSSGFGAFISAYRRLSRLGGALTVVVPDHHVLRTMDRMGLSQLFEVCHERPAEWPAPHEARLTADSRGRFH